MAFYTCTVMLVDDYGREGRKTYQSQDLDDFAAAQAARDALVADIQAVTKLGVLRTYLIEEVAVGEAPSATANRDAGMTLTVRKADSKKVSIKMYDPVPGLIKDDGTVDGDNALLTDFIANFQGAGDWTVSDGEIVESFVKGSLDEK